MTSSPLLDGWMTVLMFLRQPGLFPGMLRCEAIADRIMIWNEAAPSLTEVPAPGFPERRRWRPDLPLLIGMSVVVAVEAVTLTLANIW